MGFRNETYFKFIVDNRLPQFYSKSINIFGIIFLLVVFWLLFRINPLLAVVTTIFFSICIIGLKLILFYVSYSSYKIGFRIYKGLREKDAILIEDVSIFIKRFDKYSIKNRLSMIGDSIIYDFNMADIILFDNSMILLGKNDYFGGNQYFTPIEISNGQKVTHLKRVNLVDWKPLKDKYEIELEDPNYYQPIVLDILEVNNDIKLWLTKCKFNGRDDAVAKL